MQDGEREILDLMDERLARLDAWIQTAATPALVELRAEVEMTRVSYEHQLALTRRLVERSMRAADQHEDRAKHREERAEERAERREARLERAFDENSQALRALRDSLTGGNGPGGAPDAPAY